jgi:hypothetical protein
MRLVKSAIALLVLALAVTALAALAVDNKSADMVDAAAITTITEMEIASAKAYTTGDPSYVEKNYDDNFSGGSSWGNWETKQSILADMKDNNRTNSEVISDLNVRIYGDTAIATYTSTQNSVYHGENSVRTILSTDTFVRRDGSWKQVASHSSELEK